MASRRRHVGQSTDGGDLIGPNPTDRAKNGTKKSLLVEGHGRPLSVVVAGANVHDTKLLKPTLEAVVVPRPEPTEERPQHLCIDLGYDNPTGWIVAHEYIPHMRRSGQTPAQTAGTERYPARRWVVERTLAWLSKCRRS